MGDVGPSLAKLRRDWSTGTVEVPAGMIARRVILAAVDKLPVGSTITIERTGERGYRVTHGSEDRA